MTIGSEGLVQNPAATNYNDGLNQPPSQGKQGEYLLSEIHGKFFAGALRKNLFAFNVTAVTLPVITSNLVSVFSIWNPPSSNVHGEMVDTEIGQVLPTTVVNAIGWYFSSGSAALAGTFSTKSVALTNHFAARIGDTPNNLITPYTAYTHSGGPVRVDIIGSFGAVTDAGLTLPNKVYDGRLIIPPGVVMSVAMSTAASTGSSIDVSCRWMEWPFVN